MDLRRDNDLSGQEIAVTNGQFDFNRVPGRVFESDRVRDIFAAASCGLLWLIYLSIYLPFLPTAGNTIGNDYSLHFPNLLTGYFWFLNNGLSAIPWFSPSQCGGFAYFPDPNVAYYSVPQFLVFLVSPMRAIQLTFLMFSLIGLIGTYGLMRHAFRCSRAAAVLAAGVFVFNGFFASRMLVGHLTFHAFTLIPVLALAVLLPIPIVACRSSNWSVVPASLRPALPTCSNRAWFTASRRRCWRWLSY
jgi:hypothetical protein